MSANLPLPPAELIGHASGSLDADAFLAAGHEFLGHFRSFAGLSRAARVLDIGCGCGRMAFALAPYLEGAGSYEGVDVHAPSIAWAAENITPRYPNFRFRHSDVANTTYNPGGAVGQHRYRLPFADGSFDFVFLASVFTHMMPRAVVNYLGEISRVLTVGGRCLATFFLLNDGAARLVRAGESTFHFPYRYRTCAVRDIDCPEHCVGHDEQVVMRQFRACGLEPVRPAVYGNWSGRPGEASFHDLIITRKVRPASLLGRLRIATAHVIGDRPEFLPCPTFARAA